MNDAERLRYHGDQFYLKSAEEMAAGVRRHPGGAANTVRIAERCNVDLGKTVNHLPDFDVPGGYTLDEYFEQHGLGGVRAAAAAARARCWRPAGCGTRSTSTGSACTYEIGMIKQMKYAGYFLIVWDFIRYASEQGIPVGPGRGSAAGSVVA